MLSRTKSLPNSTTFEPNDSKFHIYFHGSHVTPTFSTWVNHGVHTVPRAQTDDILVQRYTFLSWRYVKFVYSLLQRLWCIEGQCCCLKKTYIVEGSKNTSQHNDRRYFFLGAPYSKDTSLLYHLPLWHLFLRLKNK